MTTTDCNWTVLSHAQYLLFLDMRGTGKGTKWKNPKEFINGIKIIINYIRD